MAVPAHPDPPCRQVSVPPGAQQPRIAIPFPAVFPLAANSNLTPRQISIVWLMFAGACPPFGFNIIPALLPAIQSEFALDQSRMQWMVSFYALTMGVGQLVYGPLSDAYGRRRVLLLGLAIFVLASIGATLADSYAHLLAFRFLQGIGACAALVVPRAVVRDCFSGAEAARAMALVTIPISIVPIIAPVIGGLLQTWSGWRAGFAACAVVGACLFTVALRAHHETLAPARRVSIRPGYVLRSYAGLFLSWRFCAYALAYSSLNCTFIGFFVIGPSYLSQVFGMTPIGISLAMLATYLGFTAGNLLAVRHVRRAGVDRLLAWGFAFGLGGTLLLLAVASQPVLWWMLLAVAIQSFGTGLAFSTGIAGATSVDPARAGTASALTGAIQMVTAALFAVVSGVIYDGTLVPFAWGSVALCAVAAACIWPLWRRRVPVGRR